MQAKPDASRAGLRKGTHNMARIERSEYSAHAALAASRGAAAVRKLETARKVQTLGDLLARLPFLFTVAAVAFVVLAVVAVGVL